MAAMIAMIATTTISSTRVTPREFFTCRKAMSLSPLVQGLEGPPDPPGPGRWSELGLRKRRSAWLRLGRGLVLLGDRGERRETGPDGRSEDPKSSGGCRKRALVHDLRCATQRPALRRDAG